MTNILIIVAMQQRGHGIMDLPDFISYAAKCFTIDA